FPEEDEMPVIASEKEGPRYCPVCNRRYRSGTVCADDGAQLITGTPAMGVRTLPRTAPPPPEPEQGRRGLFIGIGAVVVLLAIVAGFIVWQRAESEKQGQVAAQRIAEAATAAEQAKPKIVVQGVTDGEITVGMSAPFSGPAKELGRGMKSGIDLAFAAANEAG